MSLVAGCVDSGEDKPDVSDVKGGPDGKAEAWGSSDNPAMFNSNLEYRVAELPRNGQATNIPWAGNYWPVYQDSINYKWAGATSKSPSQKYAQAFNVTGVEDGVSRYHGIDAHSSRTACTADSNCNSAMGESCSKREGQTSGRCIPTWWGICHAWAPVAILLPEPKKAVTHNGVEFKVQDIKALLTLAFDRTETKFVSLRCDGVDSQNEISFDKYGRPTGASASCKDTNPGTFHVLMTNYLGKQGESFVYDRTWDGEVWNQPLRGYRITAMDEVTALEANKLVGVVAEGGTTVDRNGNVAGGAWTQVGTFPVTPGQSFTVAMTGTGDPDMFVKFGAQPTESSYDCRPYETGPAETCTLTVPTGQTQAFIAVNGYGSTASTFALKVTTGGSIPTTYVFNPNAAKLYKTHMDVDYISESAAGTDGHLGSTIDRYTHMDRYDYILEVDAAGKIVGGEWIGTSKKQHPDFVWLPIRSTVTTVAGGKISYANVKMIYDLSMQGEGGGGGGGTVRDITETGAVVKAAWKQYGPFNVAANTTFTATMTGDNDADLYVRKTAAPTAAAYDCRPYRDGSSESCSIVGPATVYVGVNGYAASSSFSLNIKYTEGGGTTPPTPPPVFAHLMKTGSVTQGEMKLFQLPMPAGKKVVIRTTSTTDVDLYIQFGGAPTTAAYINRGYTSSGNETVSFTATSNGVLHVGVHGYAAGSFSLNTADQ
ncbi:MAG TPA: pre-peptidase C-terminal domain-containing protein [Kofleriaceae bacterium]